MSRKTTIFKWLICIVCAAFIFGLALCQTFARMLPSQALQRPAITTEGGSAVNINGFDIWYTLYNARSDGTPIIVVAGGCALSSDYLENSLRFLADAHPVLFFDNRGCGRSEIKPDLANYSLHVFSEEIEELRRHFFPDRDIIVVAHSFGCIIAMEYAVNHLKSLQKLILVSPVSANYKPAITDTFIYFKTGLPPKDQWAANEWYISHIDMFYGPYFQDDSVKTIFNKTKVSYAVMMHIGRSKLDLTLKMKNIDMAVLLLVGGEREYPTTGIGVAQELNRLLPNARLEQFIHSGHFLFAEENKKFQRLVNEFLNESASINRSAHLAANGTL
jgi:proline iminopeptidase